MAYIRRGVKKNLCCCCETIYTIYHIYMKISSIPWDVYTGCVQYTGCVKKISAVAAKPYTIYHISI